MQPCFTTKTALLYKVKACGLVCVPFKFGVASREIFQIEFKSYKYYKILQYFRNRFVRFWKDLQDFCP